MNISERVKAVEPSVTLEITSMAKRMLREGEDVVVLAAGEPDFDTPDIVKDAAIKAMRAGQTKYTPAGGTVSLKEAICHKLKKDNGLDYTVDEIVVSCGAKHSLYNIFQVICDPGDEVILIAPFWLSYAEMVRLAGGQPKILKTSPKNGFKIGPEAISAAITKRTRAVVMNSPSNPAGVVYEKGELEKIAETCASNGVVIISDEIYENIIFDGKKHYSVPAISDEIRANTILVNGVSKSYSMTGWRIGYLAGDKEVVRKVTTLQSHSTSNPCSVSQAAAECALTADLDDEIKANCETFRQRRDFLIQEFTGQDKVVPFKPGGAFYLFCDISNCEMDSVTFAKELLEQKKVAAIPGAPFGEDGYLRISFATDIAELEKGISRIKEWVKGL